MACFRFSTENEENIYFVMWCENNAAIQDAGFAHLVLRLSRVKTMTPKQ